MLAERIGRMDLLEDAPAPRAELQPDHAHALNALGYSFADRGLRLDEAEALIARAHALMPQDPSFSTASAGCASAAWRPGRRARPPGTRLACARTPRSPPTSARCYGHSAVGTRPTDLRRGARSPPRQPSADGHRPPTGHPVSRRPRLPSQACAGPCWRRLRTAACGMHADAGARRRSARRASFLPVRGRGAAVGHRRP